MSPTQKRKTDVKNEFNTPWELCEHLWSDTSIYDADGDVVCTKSIRHCAEPCSQERLEKKARKNFDLLMAAPELLQALEQAVAVMRHAGGYADTVAIGEEAIAEARGES